MGKVWLIDFLFSNLPSPLFVALQLQLLLQARNDIIQWYPMYESFHCVFFGKLVELFPLFILVQDPRAQFQVTSHIWFYQNRWTFAYPSLGTVLIAFLFCSLYSFCFFHNGLSHNFDYIHHLYQRYNWNTLPCSSVFSDCWLLSTTTLYNFWCRGDINISATT